MNRNTLSSNHCKAKHPLLLNLLETCSVLLIQYISSRWNSCNKQTLLFLVVISLKTVISLSQTNFQSDFATLNIVWSFEVCTAESLKENSSILSEEGIRQKRGSSDRISHWPGYKILLTSLQFIFANPPRSLPCQHQIPQTKKIFWEEVLSQIFSIGSQWNLKW